ncbi:MAG: AAA family ATPase [Actinomycetia bacterium]|nr:AAA family ATPase [Actinomycetes bacterium]
MGGWMVRGERAYGTNRVPRWLLEGFVSMGAAFEGEVKSGMTNREIMDLVAPSKPGKSPQQLANGANSGRLFAGEIEIGDWVMTRDGPEVFAGLVTSEQTWHADGEDGTARRRSVDWVNPDEPLAWSELPDSLRNRVRSIRNTVGDLKDEAAVLEGLLEDVAEAAWSEYLVWAEKIYAVEGFDAVERDYKLEIAGRMGEARRLAEAGDPGWVDGLKRALGSLNNLTTGGANRELLTWCSANPEAARGFLTELWGNPGELGSLLADWPVSGSSGERISLASLLLLGADPAVYPVFKSTVLARTLELLGLEEAPLEKALPRTPNGLAALLGETGRRVRRFLRERFPRPEGEKWKRYRLDEEQVQAVIEQFEPMPSGPGELGTRYSSLIAVLDEMIERLEERGTELRDRLDAQSIAWWLAEGDPPAEWSEEEQTAFRAWRGETAPPESSLPQGAVFPAVSAGVADGLYLPQGWLQEIVDLLNQKRQVVFYGPPGTGKTYVAQRLGELVESVGGSFELVQFHPSYSYEDFFEGFRPRETETGSGVSYALRPGPLRLAAKRAVEEPSMPHLLVVDELNRGNVAKIFGELFFLLEYRDRAVPLQYSPGERFELPSNLYLIGTMNTADRSIALVDSALRRRFYFVPFLPAESPLKDVLEKWLRAEGLDTEPAWLLSRLNEAIGAQEFSIGPSYFMAARGPGGVDLDRVWRFAIKPLLEEHYYGTGRDVEEFSFEALSRRDRDAEPEEIPPEDDAA